ncbi:DUF3530 family protein [Shewanella halifaxensis]|nr:DUF3530 family protein [Shewanella halifaxensis]
MASASNADYSYLPASELKQLQVEGKDVPALLRPWLGNKQLGLTIIVPAFSERADAPGLVSNLRHELNYSGWATLALTPPSLSKAPYFVTHAEEVNKAGEQQNSVPANQEIPDFSAEQLALTQQQQRDFMLSAMAQLDSLGKSFTGKRMLIAIGNSANLVIELLETKHLPMPDILVVINPYSDIASVNKALPQKLAALSIPVLDIQSKDGSSASLATQAQRRVLSPANAPTRYSQQSLALDLSLQVAWNDSLKFIEGFANRINKAYPNR